VSEVPRAGHANHNVVFPKAGGVEHLDCAKQRKPLARISGDATGWLCLACDEPLLPGDKVEMMGHDLLHGRCRDRLRAIGGVEPSAATASAMGTRPGRCGYELLTQCERMGLDWARPACQSWLVAVITRRHRSSASVHPGTFTFNQDRVLPPTYLPPSSFATSPS
jgi:hypothetical protein